MRADVIAAERAKEIRDAARAWRRTGFVTEEVLRRVLELYPDDRRRFGPGLRALAFFFTGFGCLALIGLSVVLFEPRSEGAMSGHLFFFAALLFVGTEWQRGPARRADAGAEAATAYCAALCATIAVVLLMEAARDGGGYRDILFRIGLSAFIVSAALAWHWGDRLFHAVLAVSGFWLLAQTEYGRLFWLLASTFLMPVSIRATNSASLAPSYRRGATIVGIASVLALYAAVHIGSLDYRLIEGLNSSSSPSSSSVPAPTPDVLRLFSILATALLPPTLLALGWRRREPLLLYSGLILIGVSIATIRLYHSVMPLSVALILIGASCMLLALGLRRYLRDGPGGERHGFTADPLFDDANRTEVVRTAVSMASFSPTAQPAPARPAFEGGGGQFGGGGATGAF